MAVFLMAKFLSEALVWKYKHPDEKYYPPKSNIKYEPSKSNIKYEPFIFETARKIFSDYSSIYPKNEDFTAKIAQDLQTRNVRLIKIINPEVITPEMKSANKQFEIEIKPEQLSPQTPPAVVAEKSPSAKPAYPQPINQNIQDKVSIPQPPVDTNLSEKVNPTQPGKGFELKLPRLPANLRNAALTAGSNLSIVVRKYVGQHVTFGRAVAVAGGLAAGVATGGNPLAVAAGAGAGLLGSSYLSSPEGKTFMQNIGKGNINSSQRNSLPRKSRKSNFKSLKLLLIVGGLAFLLMVFVGGFLAPFAGPITPIGEAPGIPAGTASSLFISMSGPGGCIDNCKADNNQEITYEASLTYNGTGTANVEVSGRLPDGVDLSKASAENWSLDGKNFSQTVSAVKSKETKRLSLTFKPDTKTDFWTNHFVSASLIPSKIQSPSAGECQSKYAKTITKNPDQANFGDPQCSFNKDQLYDMLKQQDSANADFWYFKVVPCESGYNPNEYYRCDSNGNNCTPDPAGAWGLFQMGRGKNGDYDHGDVIWQEQISNAINYNKTKLQPAGLSIGGYWACAR